MTTDDLPTPRTRARTSFKLHVWCKSCRHSRDADLGALIAAGKGDQPIARMKFKCTNCESRPTDSVVSGEHIQIQR
jgi:Zn finger protein HypA/HybF involved in hydrogenase expression